MLLRTANRCSAARCCVEAMDAGEFRNGAPDWSNGWPPVRYWRARLVERAAFATVQWVSRRGWGGGMGGGWTNRPWMVSCENGAADGLLLHRIEPPPSKPAVAGLIPVRRGNQSLFVTCEMQIPGSAARWSRATGPE